MTTETALEVPINKSMADYRYFESSLPVAEDGCEAVYLHATVPADRTTYSCALAKLCNVPECELKIIQN